MTESITATQVLVEAKDVAQDAVTLVEERVSWAARNPKVLALAALTAVSATSVFLGWTLAKKKYKRLYADLAEQELAEAKQFYATLNKKDLDPVEMAQEAGYEIAPDQLALDLQTVERINVDYTKPETVPVKAVLVTDETVTVVNNVFDTADNDAGWDWADELEKRAATPDKPFIIHHDEFMQNEPGHEQISITYYEGDNVLADERDQVINDEEFTLGPDNIKFGHGSNDKNIVYIRNEGAETDFEVARSDGKYSRDVLGFDDQDEIRHSDHRPRRFRLDE